MCECRTDRSDDLDHVVLEAVQRRLCYGKAKKREYLKLELLENATGKQVRHRGAGLGASCHSRVPLTSAQDWGIQEVIDLMPDQLAQWVPNIVPLPAAGLVAAVPSFTLVAPGVVRSAEKVFVLGGAPGHILFGICWFDSGVRRFGWPQAAPAPGAPFVVRELVDAAEAARREIDLPEEWALDEHELLLTDSVTQVSCLPRPRALFDPIVASLLPRHPLGLPRPMCQVPMAGASPMVVLPGEAFLFGSLDGWIETRALAQVQHTGGALKAIEAPLTFKMVADELRGLSELFAPNLRESTQKVLRNECRIQMTKELQDDLQNARATIKGIDFARVITVCPDIEPVRPSASLPDAAILPPTILPPAPLPRLPTPALLGWRSRPHLYQVFHRPRGREGDLPARLQ